MNAYNKEYFLWGLFYLISHGGILLIPNAIYWDDWTIYRVNSSIVLDAFSQAGSMFNLNGYMHIAMLAIGPWIYKVLTFLLMLSSGFFLNLVLRRHEAISIEKRFFIVLLFLVLPVNIARVALIDFPYALCYCLFFFSWVLMSRNRFAALLLFFLSFNTNSLLVFYALPMLESLYREGAFRSANNFVSGIAGKLDFVFLPIVYWYIKTVYYAPYGVYEGYNSIKNSSFSNFQFYYRAQLEDFYLNFIYHGGYLTGMGAYAAISLTILCSIIFIAKFNLNETNRLRGNINFVLIGVLAFVLASFPYGFIGHIPTFLEWTSRHQLLLPLGLSLFFVGFSSLWGNRLRIFFLSFVLAISVVVNVKNYIGLYMDWEKQKQLVSLFRAESRIKNSGLIGFDDATSSFNAIGRSYRDYEWNGLLKLAFGDELRFGTSSGAIEGIAKLSQDTPVFTARYNAADYKNNGTRETIYVKIVNADTKDVHSDVSYWPQPLKLKLVVKRSQAEK